MKDGTDRSAAARIAARRGRGRIRAYQDLVVGSRSWVRLLQYELLVSWGAPLPGVAGLALRALTWRSVLGSVGPGVVWGRNITLRHSLKMQIGAGVTVDDGCQLDAQGCAAGEFSVGDGTLISRGCIVSGKDGPLRIGQRVNIGANCVLYASTLLEIGSDSLIAAMCYLGGGRYTSRGRTDLPIAQQQESRHGVVIEQDCWLGAGATVIDGVRIGRGSIVGAGAVVVQDVDPYSVMVGVPAHRVASRGEKTE